MRLSRSTGLGSHFEHLFAVLIHNSFFFIDKVSQSVDSSTHQIKLIIMQRFLNYILIKCTLNPIQAKLDKWKYFWWFIEQDFPKVELDLTFLVKIDALLSNQVAKSVQKLAIFISCSAFHTIKLQNNLLGQVILLQPSNNVGYSEWLTLVRIYRRKITVRSELLPYKFDMAICIDNAFPLVYQESTLVHGTVMIVCKIVALVF